MQSTPLNQVNDTLVHYCPLGAFFDIVRKKEIWLTEAAKMNDKTECRWLNYLLENHIGKNDFKDLKYARSFVVREDIHHAVADVFLCCFSRATDMVGQWMAYANNGSGVALELKFDALDFPREAPLVQSNQIPAIGLCEVIYDRFKQKQILEDFMSRLSGITIRRLKKADGKKLLRYSVQFKNPCFADEQEVRLVCQTSSWPSDPERIDVPEYGIKGWNYRPTKYGLSPYLTLALRPEYLTAVWIGPCNDSSERHISRFLKENGFANVEIKRSLSTYR